MDAVLLVSHKVTPSLLVKYKQITEAFITYGECFLLLEENDNTRPFLSKENNIYSYNWEKLKSIGFIPIKDAITPGSNHFVLLSFFLTNPNYDNYWSIEYDVDFLGEWRNFFVMANAFEEDFISSHIQCYRQNPQWYWWSAFHNKSDNRTYDISLVSRIRSFNPIYRISKDALNLVCSALNNGVYGHHEVVIPSLLYHNNFKIRDFGGISEDALEKGNSGLYVNVSRLSMFGSMQHIPFHDLSCLIKWRNVLVHPVK